MSVTLKNGYFEPMVYKAPAVSETIKTEVVCPNDTNPMGILQGGKLVQWMDIAAAVCAQTHAERICVTAKINEVQFKHPAHVGDIVTIRAKITRAFKSSMEILVQAQARKVLIGKNNLISEAFFTFVAIDENKNPCMVAPVNPVTQAEKKIYKEALQRKEHV